MRWGRNGYLPKTDTNKKYKVLVFFCSIIGAFLFWNINFTENNNSLHLKVISQSNDIEAKKPSTNNQSFPKAIVQDLSDHLKISIIPRVVKSGDYPLLGDKIILVIKFENQRESTISLLGFEHKIVPFEKDKKSFNKDVSFIKNKSSSSKFDIKNGSTTTTIVMHTISEKDIEAGGVTVVLNTRETVFKDRIVPQQVLLKVPLQANPNLDIVKTAILNDEIIADGIAQVGETIEYTYTITNTGNVALNNIGVQDRYPNSLLPKIEKAISKNSQYTKDVQLDGVWDTLGSGDTIQFVYKLTIAESEVN